MKLNLFLGILQIVIGVGLGVLLGVLSPALVHLAVATLPIGGIAAAMATTATFALIFGGVFDVIEAANCAIFGTTFSWKRYFIQKAVSYSLCFAFGAVIYSIPAQYNLFKLIEKVEDALTYPVIYGECIIDILKIE